MKKTLLAILCLLCLSAAGQDFLKNGSFEYGLNTGWDYTISTGSTATFTLDNGSKVMDGSVALKINVSTVSKTNIKSIKASTSFNTGSDSIYLLRFWARGPEESKIYVEVPGSNTTGVTYQMHTGKTMFYFPFKYKSNTIGANLKVNFYFQDDRTNTKKYSSTECTVTASGGAIYYLDGVEVLDPNNKQSIDVISTYKWNNNLPSATTGWVAGDNDVSLTLPDGRTIWFFNDSFYSKASPTINRLADMGKFIRNAVAIQDTNGRITTRPVSDQNGQTVFFRIPNDQLILEGTTAKNFFWVGDAIMEDGKVKVYLIEIQEVNGTTVGTNRSYLASFSYPGLTYLGLERQADFCAGFETFFADDEDNKLYMYRSENQSYTHIARTDIGNLSGKNGSWEYWNGTGWTSNKTEGDSPSGRINNMMADGVVKLGHGNYAQVSMPVLSHDVQVSFASAPQGPWTTKQTVYTATKDSASWYYMPNFHGKLPNGKYSISFSANFTYCLFFCKDCQTWAFVDKYWYRPRYIQVDLLALSPFTPKKDCAGIENGTAYVDSCEECVGGTTGKQACIVGVAKLYSGNNLSGAAIGLNVGDYLFSDLLSLGCTDNDLSSIELADGYVAELYDGDNYAGDSKILNETTLSLETVSFDNKTTSIIIRRKGVSDLSGIFALQNKQSGLYMSIQNQSKDNNALVVQSQYSADDSQHFRLENAGFGYYHVVNNSSDLAIAPIGLSKNNRANIIQWNGLNYLDITDYSGGQVSAQYDASVATEGIGYLTDNKTSTKYRTLHGSGWVQFYSENPQVVVRYSITSANNAPVADPKNWSLYGSSDGSNWVMLDTITGAKFQSRYEERYYDINNKFPYKYYRMNMQCYSGSTLHLAEWKLFTAETTKDNEDNLKFIVQDTGDGCVKFYNKRSDMAIEVLDGYQQVGANVWQTQDIGQSGTLWKLVSVEQLGVEDLFAGKQSNNEVLICPNPVVDRIHLDLPSEWDGSECAIYNVSGVRVCSGKTNKSSFDVSSLPSGYYLIRIQNKANSLVNHFIKK